MEERDRPRSRDDLTHKLHNAVRFGLKHPIDHAHFEVHMRVQARVKAVNEGNCAQVQAGRGYLCLGQADGKHCTLEGRDRGYPNYVPRTRPDPLKRAVTGKEGHYKWL